MHTVTTKIATAAEWDDIQQIFSDGGDSRSCQCVWPLLRTKDWKASNLEQRTALLRSEVVSGPPPGIVAYVDDQPAGWVRVGSRTSQTRLLHTRAIAANTTESLTDTNVWAVTCFSVRREHRGKGLNTSLLKAAINLARASGARVIEGYPLDTSVKNVTSNELFQGSLSTFLTAGFEVRRTLRPGRPLVSLTLQ